MEIEPAPPPGRHVPAPAPPPGTHAPPGAVPPAGAGSWTAAAIVLLLVGVASAAYNGWDLALLAEDLAIFDRAGIGSVGSALLAIDVGLVVSGLLQAAGAITILVRRSRDRILALAGCVGTLFAWVAFLALVVGRDLLAGVSVGAWIMFLVSTSGAVLAGGLLLTGGRRRGRPGAARADPSAASPDQPDGDLGP
jgi:hypothetical protein